MKYKVLFCFITIFFQTSICGNSPRTKIQERTQRFIIDSKKLFLDEGNLFLITDKAAIPLKAVHYENNVCYGISNIGWGDYQAYRCTKCGYVVWKLPDEDCPSCGNNEWSPF